MKSKFKKLLCVQCKCLHTFFFFFFEDKEIFHTNKTFSADANIRIRHFGVLFVVMVAATFLAAILENSLQLIAAVASPHNTVLLSLSIYCPVCSLFCVYTALCIYWPAPIRNLCICPLCSLVCITNAFQCFSS